MKGGDIYSLEAARLSRGSAADLFNGDVGVARHVARAPTKSSYSLVFRPPSVRFDARRLHPAKEPAGR